MQCIMRDRQDSAAWRWMKKKKKTWIRSRGVDGWGRKNSYETCIRSSCNAACRVGMGWCNGDTGERDDISMR